MDLISEKIRSAQKILNVHDPFNQMEVLNKFYYLRSSAASLSSFQCYKKILELTKAKNTFMEFWAERSFLGTQYGEIFVPSKFPEYWKLEGCNSCKGVGIFKFTRKEKGMGPCPHCKGTSLKSYDCKDCNSSGKLTIHKSDGSLKNCPTCVGTGKWQNRTPGQKEKCLLCRGTGGKLIYFETIINSKQCFKCDGTGLISEPIDINSSVGKTLKNIIDQHDLEFLNKEKEIEKNEEAPIISPDDKVTEVSE